MNRCKNEIHSSRARAHVAFYEYRLILSYMQIIVLNVQIIHFNASECNNNALEEVQWNRR